MTRGRKKKRKKKKPLASRHDVHDLYRESVQDPPEDAKTLAKLYKRFRKKHPTVFREDFCGTATLSTAFVKQRKDRTAIGVDLDGPTLHWGHENVVLPEGDDVASRVLLIEGNVLHTEAQKADLTCALNFSYCVFHERSQLAEYFKAVHRGLVSDGIFILDILGGPEVMTEEVNETDCDDFVYRWEQAKFDPLTHRFLCHIHFDFPDGSSIEKAFTYDWRLWTVPELRDLLLECGFSDVHLMWEKTDKDGEGTGKWLEPSEVENQEAWWTYIVAER